MFSDELDLRRNNGVNHAAYGGAGGVRLACSCQLSPARAGQLVFIRPLPMEFNAKKPRSKVANKKGEPKSKTVQPHLPN